MCVVCYSQPFSQPSNIHLTKTPATTRQLNFCLFLLQLAFCNAYSDVQCLSDLVRIATVSSLQQSGNKVPRHNHTRQKYTTTDPLDSSSCIYTQLQILPRYEPCLTRSPKQLTSPTTCTNPPHFRYRNASSVNTHLPAGSLHHAPQARRGAYVQSGEPLDLNSIALHETARLLLQPVTNEAPHSSVLLRRLLLRAGETDRQHHVRHRAILHKLPTGPNEAHTSRSVQLQPFSTPLKKPYESPRSSPLITSRRTLPCQIC